MRLRTRFTLAIGVKFHRQPSGELKEITTQATLFFADRKRVGVENNTGCQFVFTWNGFYSEGALFR
jgi:hypothetical protein